MLILCPPLISHICCRLTFWLSHASACPSSHFPSHLCSHIDFPSALPPPAVAVSARLCIYIEGYKVRERGLGWMCDLITALRSLREVRCKSEKGADVACVYFILKFLSIEWIVCCFNLTMLLFLLDHSIVTMVISLVVICNVKWIA